jgi:hypothetical protein
LLAGKALAIDFGVRHRHSEDGSVSSYGRAGPTSLDERRQHEPLS